MRAVWYRTRSQLRQRWRATLALVLLVGVVGAVVLTTVAGARRTATAYERFREVTLAGDLDVAPSEPTAAALEELRRLPQVAAMTTTSYPFVVPADSGQYPFTDFLAMASQDTEFGTTIDLSRMAAGRMPDPDRADEMAITEGYAREAELTAGDRVDFDSYAPEQFEQLFGSGDVGPPGGPDVTLTVTGVVQVPDMLSESSGSFFPRVLLTPAFLREHAETMAIYPGGARLRLREGAADLPAVTEAVQRIFADDPELELQPATEITAKIDDSLDVLVTGLLLCALTVGLVGAVVIAQALARHLAREEADERTLAALGMSRGPRAGALWALAAPVAVGGATLAVALAVAASPTMPVGLARRAEPDPGVAVDLGVLLPGFFAVMVVVAAVSGAAAAAATRATRSEVGPDLRPSRVWRAMSGVGLRPAGTIGVGLAVGGRGGTTGSVAANLGGITFGVAGLVATTVFAASITTLTDSAPRYGYPWHALAAGFQGDLLEQSRHELLDDPEVEALGLLTTGLARTQGADVNIHALDSLKGTPDPTVLDGRLPGAPDEVAVGTGTLRDSGARIGDRIEVTGYDGPTDLLVVGVAAFPIVDDRSSVDRGLLLTTDAAEALASPETLNRDFVVRWTPDLDPGTANEQLAARTGLEVSGPRTPSEVLNLGRVEGMPRTMALALGAFVLLAGGHALTATARRRRHDLAMLRSLGFVGRDLSATMAWQALALGTVGLLVGIPLGVVAGRAAWRAVASGLGVVDQPTVPVLALALMALGTLVALQLAALLPARRIRRLRPAQVLRAG